MRFFNTIAAFLWGNDIFISYSRSDASFYAEQLAIVLQDKKLKCYIDKWGTQPGQKLSNGLKRILKQSSVLVVLGSKAASNSIYITEEINIFLKTKRTIVPIDFGYLEISSWFTDIKGLSITVETNESLVQSIPSMGVIKRIENSLTYWRQANRIRLVTGVFLTALFIVLGLIYFTSKQLSVIQKDRARMQNQMHKDSVLYEAQVQKSLRLQKVNDSNQNKLSNLFDSIIVANQELNRTKQNLITVRNKEKTSRAAANVFRNMNEDLTSNAAMFMSQLSDSALNTIEKARINAVKNNTRKMISSNDSSKTKHSEEIKKFDRDSMPNSN